MRLAGTPRGITFHQEAGGSWGFASIRQLRTHGPLLSGAMEPTPALSSGTALGSKVDSVALCVLVETSAAVNYSRAGDQQPAYAS